MKLRGQGVGAGAVLGTAAVVRTRNSVALMPSVPSSIADLQASKRLLDKPDIVLVAEHYGVALSVADTLAWGTVVGIASADDPVPSAGSVPAVVGVANLLSSIPEEALLLLDAERGIVSVNPDFVEIAQFQAEKENINPRKRFFLDAQHEPAQTEDGRPFAVFRTVFEEESLPDIIREGVDGLLCDAFYFGSDEEGLTPESLAHMARLAQQAGGKPVIVRDDFYLLPPELAVAGAVHCELIVAVEPFRHGSIKDIAVLRQQWQTAIDTRIEQDETARMPHAAALLKSDFWETDTLEHRIEMLAAKGTARLLVPLATFGVFDNAALAKLDALIQVAAPFLLPLFVIVEPMLTAFGEEENPDLQEQLLTLLLGVGAAGIITEDATAEYKSIVRRLNSEAARAEAFSRLSPPPAHSPANDAV